MFILFGCISCLIKVFVVLKFESLVLDVKVLFCYYVSTRFKILNVVINLNPFNNLRRSLELLSLMHRV